MSLQRRRATYYGAELFLNGHVLRPCEYNTHSMTALEPQKISLETCFFIYLLIQKSETIIILQAKQIFALFDYESITN